MTNDLGSIQLDSEPPLETSASPELTFRSVVSGLLIGCLLCFTNLYFGLQTGWISMMSLQSALLGYLLSLLFYKTPMTPQENVVLQTTAVATGTMPLAAGFVGIIPALSLLNYETDGIGPINVTWFAGVAWSLGVAFFGVFLASPLRKQVIIKEKLVFPSGTATAQLISVLHKTPLRHEVVSPYVSTAHKRRGYEQLDVEEPIAVEEAAEELAEGDEPSEFDREKLVNVGWALLGKSFSASAAITLLAYFFPAVYAIPIFGVGLARNWLWVFSPSLSYVGQGIIMGLPTTVSMNLGMLVGWGILSPLSKYNGWAPGAVGSVTDGARGWIMWIALAIMTTESLVSLAPVAAEIIRSLRGVRSNSDASAEDDEKEPPERLVPIKWSLWGGIVSALLGTLVIRAVFGSDGIKPWASIIGFILASLLSLLAVRALGETDLNPVSGLGKISQLLFAVLQPGNVVANIVAGGVAEAGAQQSAELMQDLKCGHLVGASPRAQFHGQLIGSALSVLVTSTAYTLYTRTYPIPGTTFPAPTAYMWLSLARLLRDGNLPEKSAVFMLASGILAALVGVLKLRATARGRWYARWIPSGVAFAIGFLNTPSFSMARLIGGIAEYVYRKRLREQGGEQSDIGIILVGSGFVLGEGVISIVSLVLKSFGVPSSCFGCLEGVCSC